jgi:hypothetical protein
MRCEKCRKPFGKEVGQLSRGRWHDLETGTWFDEFDNEITVPARHLQYERIYENRPQTAHLGMPLEDGRPGNKHNKRDCRLENLTVLCRSCHLFLDQLENIGQNRRGLDAPCFQAGYVPETEILVAWDGEKHRFIRVPFGKWKKKVWRLDVKKDPQAA